MLNKKTIKMEENKIRSAPKRELVVNDDGLRNLAAWIARYDGLGLELDDASPFVCDLINSGKLATFEPSLAGKTVFSADTEDCYQMYEFIFLIKDLIHLDQGCYVDLSFGFLNDKCFVFPFGDKIEGQNLEVFRIMGIDPLRIVNYESEEIFLSWEEADNAILDYLEYRNNPKIPSVPN